MNRKTRRIALLVILALAALVLAGCGVPQGEVDLSQPPPVQGIGGLWDLVVYYLARVLMFFNDVLAGIGIPYSYGFAIILLTVILKIVTLPLNRKQLQSAKAQQELQPKLRELQQKYGKDRQKLSEEQMKLYKEMGVNPLGGCLPLLIQLPILWGLYQALYLLANPSANELWGAPFFWIPNLAFPTLAVGTKWIGESFRAQDWAMLFAYFSLPLLMIVTQLLQQKMAQPPKDGKGAGQDTQTQMMGQMMLFMPIMFGYITLGLPSGLTLYWTVSNILSMIQQYFVTGWGGLADWFPFLKRRQETTPLPATAATGGAGNPGGKVAQSGNGTGVEGSAATVAVEKPVKRRRRKK